MADGNQQPDPFQQAAQIPGGDVPRDWRERIGGALTGGTSPDSPLNKALNAHHAQRLANAQMYKMNAATAQGALWSIRQGIDPENGMRFDDPAYKGKGLEALKAQHNANYDEAMQNFEKIVGVNKPIKDAIAKARGIVEHLTGHTQEQQGQPQRPGGMTPPPSAPQATVMEGGVTLAPPPTPPGQAPVTADPNFAAQAPFLRHSLQVGQSLADTRRTNQAAMAMREDEAKKIGLDPNSREYKQYVAIGSFPAASRLTKMPYKDPKTGKILEGGYDGSTGAIFDQEGHIVPNAEPASLASMTPKKISYKDPNTGAHVLGMQVGNQLFDLAGNELPAGTEAFDASLVPKTTTGSTEKIDPLTGKRERISSSKTTAPAGAKITGPGGYRPGGMTTPPTAPGKTGGGTSTAKPSSPAASLPGKIGTKASQDEEREAAYLKRNNLKNLTSSTRTMIEAAPKVENLIDRIGPQIDKISSELGPASGRWTEFMAGKVGAKNPDYIALRSNVDLLTTLLMRMHVGARGGEYIMKHFKDMLDQGKQDPDNLRAALKEVRTYANDVIQEGKDAGLDIGGRTGGMSAPPSTGTAGGGITIKRDANGRIIGVE